VPGQWYEQQARRKWPDLTASPIQLRVNWYAFRAVQLCRIVKGEFGKEASRVRCVANGQASSAWVSDQMLECEFARPELGGRCSRDFDDLSIAPYFGYALGLPANATAAERWLAQPDGGRSGLFEALTRRGGSLDIARDYVVENKKIADKHGLALTAYEDGQHLHTRPGPLAQLFAAANRDPRMAQALMRHFEDWKSAGGQLDVPYTYVKRSGASGHWGLKESQDDDQAPKWQAVRGMRDQPCWWKGCGR